MCFVLARTHKCFLVLVSALWGQCRPADRLVTVRIQGLVWGAASIGTQLHGMKKAKLVKKVLLFCVHDRACMLDYRTRRGLYTHSFFLKVTGAVTGVILWMLTGRWL